MKLLILALVVTGCANLYTAKEVIKINNCLIQKQIDLCGDLICEGSVDPLREEAVMADLGQALMWNWEEEYEDEECFK